MLIVYYKSKLNFYPWETNEKDCPKHKIVMLALFGVHVLQIIESTKLLIG